MICVAIFALASLLCGFAWSLEALVLFRIIQGLGGGGMATSEQAILADSFPPEKRGQAFAIYGIAVVVAPVVGPTLGGWIADTYSWHWVFLINVPMGLLSLLLVGSLVSEPSGAEQERARLLKDGLRVDYVGAGAFAGWCRNHDYDADCGKAYRSGAAEIPAHRRCVHRSHCDVASDGPDRRYLVQLRRAFTHLSCLWSSSSIPSGHDGIV